MRSIAILILTAMLTIGMLAAQEETDDVTEAPTETATDTVADTETEADEDVDVDVDVRTFAPSETVKADTAIAFPTDI